MNIPKCMSRGLMPEPSCGMISSWDSGFAKNTMTAMRNINTIAIIAVAYGEVNGRRLLILTTAMDAMMLNMTAKNNMDPALPA